ncbi:MAG TPA: hypothetical protein VES95_13290 [Dermatophilaceae bacterium]|nr:hypothetical protein [Dermatophilaceae bacterium]
MQDVLRDAGGLATESRLAAQAVASAWLGEAWSKRSPGHRGAEAALVTALVGVARRTRRPTAYLALHALATIPGDWREEVADALERAPEAAPVPAWATDPRAATPELPTRARLWSDPWGSELTYLLDYEEPEPHQLLVPISTVGGTYVQTLVVGHRDGWPPEGSVGEQTLRGEVDPAEALAAVADAMWHTDLVWPPQDDVEYVLARSLVHWRASGRRTERDREPLPDTERRALLDDFAAAHGPELGLDPGIVEVASDTFVDFGEGYLVGGVLAWSPGEVERFLLHWVTRKVLLDDEAATAVPDVLRVWVAFALRRQGLAEEHIAPVVAAVDALRSDYDEARAPGNRGPAAELMARMVEQGFDLDDPDAIAGAVAAYHAEQNARRVLDGR